MLKKCAGVRSFLEQYGERRDVVVPLDERRTGTEPGERFLVKRPHFGFDARTVIVDTQRASIRELPNRVARQVELADFIAAGDALHEALVHHNALVSETRQSLARSFAHRPLPAKSVKSIPGEGPLATIDAGELL